MKTGSSVDASRKSSPVTFQVMEPASSLEPRLNTSLMDVSNWTLANIGAAQNANNAKAKAFLMLIEPPDKMTVVDLPQIY